MTEYIVATDGACKGNPGPCGWAWVGEDGRWAAGAIPQGTNNIGELTAVLRAVTDHADVAHLRIQADSTYAIDTYTKWMDGHKRRGWKTSAKKPVKNQDILEAMIEARDARRAAGLPDVVFEHMRGHAGHRLNGWADERAVRASRHAAQGLAREWTTDAGQERLDVSADAPASGEDKPTRGRR
ncbi:ribonuclease H [Microbacterium sp. ZXX196]|uniref:ribonuclease H family protein n=1 Tax=Microbacterium sp. ZXX196 TaxID=2609291 RepID=UPI0012B82DD3|nr:ribonuclease H [Microbacterium sp. ZXX196]MTE23804.1 ribonuclease HI [Microbacterium sp. ZXX196]